MIPTMPKTSDRRDELGEALAEASLALLRLARVAQRLPRTPRILPISPATPYSPHTIRPRLRQTEGRGGVLR